MSVKLMIERETDSVSFFLQTQLLMKISKSRKRAKQNFLSPKKLSKITFLKLCYLYVSSNFELIELYLFFQKIFRKSLTWTLKIFIAETLDRKFSKNLKKIDFSILVFLDDSENLESFELYLFLCKNSIILYYYYTY